MRFSPNGHFSGNAQDTVDLTAPIPWLYIIAGLKSKVVYIGETHDQGGLVVRLGSHFGPYPRSDFRQAAARTVGIHNLKGPFVVVAAQLPVDDPDVRFNGDSRKERRLCETLVHEHVGRRVARSKKGWTVISTAQSSGSGENDDITYAAESISACFFAALEFLEELTPPSPFHLVTLSGNVNVLTDVDAGTLLNQIEMLLFEWLLDCLKRKYGDGWWSSGVPRETRVRCASLAEEENKGLPSEAYLTFIDLRRVVQNNWEIFGSALEKVTKERGKDRATAWLVELNEARKSWAHPIRQRFESGSPPSLASLMKHFERAQALREWQ